MKKGILIIALAIALPFNSFSQQATHEKIDSIRFVVSNAKEDTAKVNAMLTLSGMLRFQNSDSSLLYAEKALALATDLNYNRGMAHASGRLGAIYADQGRYNQGASIAYDAIAMYEKILATAKPTEKTEILKKMAGAYNVVGHNRISQGNYNEGLNVSFRALKIREDIGDLKGILDTKWNIGTIFLTQKNFEDALKYYRDCLKISQQLNSKIEIAQCYGVIGDVYFNLGNYTEAWEYYSISLKEAKETSDVLTIAEINVSVGLLMYTWGKYDEALKFNFEGLKTYRDIGSTFNIAMVYNSIAMVYIKQKKFSDAKDYLDNALSFSREIGNMEYIKLSYENLAKYDSIQGDFKKSLHHYKTFIAYRDSLLNKENTKKMTEQQMQYDFDKKEDATKIEQYKKDIEQRNIRNSILAGLGGMFIFSIVVFRQRNKISKEKKRSDTLLLNILPAETAEELKNTGTTKAKNFSDVTVLFTDFKNFTAISENLTAQELVNEINYCYSAFDSIITKHGIEKIKTIGDSYMCACGLPVENTTNAEDTIRAAIEIRDFIETEKQNRIASGRPYFDIRIGCHTGPVVAGIVGIKKFAYDIWGDTVNIASRMESSGEAGKINISGSTYQLVKDKFKCEHRGKIEAKNKGSIDMYFVETLT